MTDFSKILWDSDGAEVERESFRRIDSGIPPEIRNRFSPEEWRVVRRIIHTGGDFSLAELVEFHLNPIAAGLKALRSGALIYSDSHMIKAGLSVAKLRKCNPAYSRESILCPSAEPETAEYASAHHITRALASVRIHAERIRGSVFLCGNAPLALAGVARMCLEEGIRPALIVGMPVGFVNVTESKALLDALAEIPWVRISGRRGGSPFAVAALHGILESASLP